MEMDGGGNGARDGGVLGGLHPIREDHAVAPLVESFNWAECLEGVDDVDWYVVAFRSVRAAESDDALLIELDQRAHDEAISHTGLVHYFGGELDEQRRCLSFCVWEDRARAVEAAGLPRHRDAIDVAARMYDSYVLERYRLTTRAGKVDFEQIEPPQRSEALGRA